MEFDCKYAKPTGEIVSPFWLARRWKKFATVCRSRACCRYRCGPKGWSLSRASANGGPHQARRLHPLQSAVCRADQGGSSDPPLPGSAEGADQESCAAAAHHRCSGPRAFRRDAVGGVARPGCFPDGVYGVDFCRRAQRRPGGVSSIVTSSMRRPSCRSGSDF